MRRRSETTKPDVKGEGAGFIRRPKGLSKAAETPFVPSKAVAKRIAFRGESGNKGVPLGIEKENELFKKSEVD